MTTRDLKGVDKELSLLKPDMMEEWPLKGGATVVFEKKNNDFYASLKPKPVVVAKPKPAPKAKAAPKAKPAEPKKAEPKSQFRLCRNPKAGSDS